MIPTDTLTCQVTPNSVEPTSLSCNVPPLEHLALWDFLVSNAGTWATVGATMLLAYFAWKAWTTAQHTLTAMQEQTAGSITANQELAAETRQFQYLVEYSMALMQFAEAVFEMEADAKKAAERTTLTWMSWAMELFRTDPEFRDLTAKWNKSFIESGISLHMELAAKGQSATHFILKEMNEDLFKAQVGSYVGKLQVWQAAPKRRMEMRNGLIDLTNSSLAFGASK